MLPGDDVLHGPLEPGDVVRIARVEAKGKLDKIRLFAGVPTDRHDFHSVIHPLKERAQCIRDGEPDVVADNPANDSHDDT